MNAILALVRSVIARWPWWALGTSLTMLAIAHAFEAFLLLAPCPLCLTQREVYWLAAGVSALAIIAPRTSLPAWTTRALCVVLALLFFAGAAVATFHAGLEWDWWELRSCGTRGFLADLLHLPQAKVNVSAMADLLAGKPMPKASCENALWRDPVLALSMAGWNVLISLKLAVYSLLAALKRA